MQTRIFSSFILAALILAAAPVFADSFESTPTSVILYKNGLAWVTEEGRGSTQTEWVDTMLHSAPVIGTLQVEPRGTLKVTGLKAKPGMGDPYLDGIQALQEEIIGQQVWIQAMDKTLAGTYMGISHGAFGGGPMVLLQMKDGSVFVPIGKIEKVSVNGGIPGVKGAKGKRQPTLSMKLEGNREKYHVVSSYMTRELGWIPVYRLELLEKEKGNLVMEAAIVNNAMDLTGVQVRFATGEATFPLRWTDSPLYNVGTSPQQVMDQVMGRVGNGGMFNIDNDFNNPAYNFMNAVPAQQMVMGGGGVDQPRFSGEETHLYGPRKVTLESGERAIVPLGGGKVPAKFLYRFQAPLTLSNEPNQRNNVWLAAHIINKLSFPLTTGPILVTKGGRPSGQGFVTYTHKGGEVLVPISIASSVLASAAEQELDRNKSAKTFRGAKYDKVVVKGTIAVENLQDRTISIRIEKPINGKVTKTSHKGDAVEQFASAYDPNPRSHVKWTVDIEAGKKSDITYTYEYFVQRHNKGSW